MPFFSRKTADELRSIFSQYSLEHLQKAQQRYDSSHTDITARATLATSTLTALKARLRTEEASMLALKGEEADAIQRDEERQRDLADIMDDRSVDTYLVKIQLSYSSLKNHYDKVSVVKNQIQHLTEVIANLESRQTLLRQEKKACLDALQIISEYIDSKIEKTSDALVL